MNWQCPFGLHSKDWHRGSTDANGVTHKLCDRCLRPVGVLLSGSVKREPLITIVAGTPSGRAQRARNNVAEFPKASGK